MPQRTLRRAVSDEDKEQRRKEILAAAKQVFADRGYHATTIADVARGAGLSYGVVYWYFDSKDELFHALMADEEARLRSRINQAIAALDGADVGQVLRTAVRATFEVFDEDRASTKLLFREPSSLGEDFERHLFGIFERFISDMEQLVQRAQRDGYLRQGPPRMIAVVSAGLIGQLALRRLRTDDDLSPTEAAEFLVGVLLEGLGNPERSAPPRSRRRSAAPTTSRRNDR